MSHFMGAVPFSWLSLLGMLQSFSCIFLDGFS